MKKLALVALLSLGFATPASAHHCLGSHASDPVCPGGGVPGDGGIGVLRDAGDNIIGKVVSITNPLEPRVSILFDMLGETFLAQIQTAGLPAGQELAGFERLGNVFFTDADCMGAAWIRERNAVTHPFFEEFHGAVIVGDGDTDPDERKLYMADMNVPASQQAMGSVLQDKCDPTNQTLDFVPALLLNPDLHTTFPKPYTLDLN